MFRGWVKEIWYHQSTQSHKNLRDVKMSAWTNRRFWVRGPRWGCVLHAHPSQSTPEEAVVGWVGTFKWLLTSIPIPSGLLREKNRISKLPTFGFSDSDLEIYYLDLAQYSRKVIALDSVVMDALFDTLCIDTCMLMWWCVNDSCWWCVDMLTCWYAGAWMCK